MAESSLRRVNGKAYKHSESFPIRIACTLPAIFDMTKELTIRKERGEKTYLDYMRSNIDTPLSPARLFPLAKQFLSLNDANHAYIHLHILTKCHQDTGNRVRRSLQHYGMAPDLLSPNNTVLVHDRGTNGQNNILNDQKIDFYFSTNITEVCALLHNGEAAGFVQAAPAHPLQEEGNGDVLTLAADFDRVLAIACGDPDNHPDHYHIDNEAFTRAAGLQAAHCREEFCADIPAYKGPAASFFHKLILLRDCTKNDPEKPKLSFPLVTARTEAALYRIHTTLEDLDLRFDDLIPVGDGCKGEVLRKHKVSLFVDDSARHIRAAIEKSPGTLAVHMPWVDAHTERLFPQAPKTALNPLPPPLTPRP